MLRTAALEARLLARPATLPSPALRRLVHSAPSVARKAASPTTTPAPADDAAAARRSLRTSASQPAAGTAHLSASGAAHEAAPALPDDYKPQDPLATLDAAYLSRTTAHLQASSLSDLMRQWVVYAVSEQSLLVSMGPWFVAKLQWANDNVPVLGPAAWAVFAAGMNSTFYRVFVGGETVPGCAEQVQRYADRGIGVMLNYSAEAPLGTSKAGGGIDEAAMTEITNAVGEAARLIPSSSTADAAAIKPALLAIKLTGLIYDASILARATTALINDPAVKAGGRVPSDILFPKSDALSAEDHELLDKLYAGLRKVASEAQKHNLRLLVDAEQSWFQPAIDRFVDLLSEEYNRVRPASSSDAPPSAPIVYNTYQCYLRDAPARIKEQLAHADKHGYSFGAKLVRGAYQEAERALHEKNPVAEHCVVHGTKADTDNCYDECAGILEKRLVADLAKKNAADQPGVGVVLASHNGTSMKKFLQSLRDDGLAKEEDGGLRVDERVRGRVAFGQLMGMSDNLTISLINLMRPHPSGPGADPTLAPLVVKYMPYASLAQGLPYLTRRASENQSILKGDPTSGRGGAREERRAVGKEIRRRFGIPF
ncbi:hypothetical protein Rhopal_005498-T1 [Rhodotorula paludigena]|uniref:Proline dehydrogenase n=1 Tax=Rhodotorula paludigena TaxID=86838 RepID=A0AAV5GV50_9BASI|nr:hypothetical protein Rhopal_005498-T1 [Rhodotorula paludigena]